MTEEEIIAALLPCQQVVIAKASLAGFRFDPWHEPRRIESGWQQGSWKKGKVVTSLAYTLVGPDGAMHGDYHDIYEAACAAVAIVEEHDKPKEIEGFKLEEGNEQ